MKQSLHSLRWKCLFVAVTLCFSSSVFAQEDAQKTTEAGITVGPMVFLGDLGGHAGKGTTFIKDYNMNTTKLAFGAFYAAYPTQWLGFRLSATFGSIEGDDGNITPKGGDEETRLARHLDFRSKIIEGTIMAEVYPTVFLEEEPDDVTARLRPYGVIGLGLFHFNPQGSYRNQYGDVTWVDLQPLHTEGQGFPEYPDRKPYKLTQMNIPIGVGIKYFLSENLNLSFEIVHRKTFTDYIDDVSTRYVDPALFAKYLSPSQAAIALAMSNKSAQGYNTPGYGVNAKRGDPTQNDAYFTAQFKLGIRIAGRTETRWRNSTHCPLLRF
ncbi:MAG TPA: hypothetical protein VHE34_29275 [Puia sp.]|uniref:hypothetical protein n=1 Tax=Puia sp. TaxID=2045100 RepID=UPI002BB9AEBF|nr:hypothetical protein [Puia sp.]HVU99362.1 hypothetical protein [Puia sp.]